MTLSGDHASPTMPSYTGYPHEQPCVNFTIAATLMETSCPSAAFLKVLSFKDCPIGNLARIFAVSFKYVSSILFSAFQGWPYVYTQRPGQDVKMGEST